MFEDIGRYNSMPWADKVEQIKRQQAMRGWEDPDAGSFDGTPSIMDKILGRNIEGPSPLAQAFSGKSPLVDGGDTGFLSMAQGMYDKDPTMFKGLLSDIAGLGRQKAVDKLMQVKTATAPFSNTKISDLMKMFQLSSSGRNPAREMDDLNIAERMRKERDARLAKGNRFANIAASKLLKQDDANEE